MRADFAKAAATYDAAAVLAQEVGRRMAARLDYTRIAPKVVADIGCATGDGIHDLQQRYPQALPVALDFALPMLGAVRARSSWLSRWRGKAPRLINADVQALPLRRGSVDLVWSNLMLHWLADPEPAFAQIQRSMAVGGLFTFSTLGPQTLQDLRLACDRCGIVPPLRLFLDMHDVGDKLVNAGFADPVMDTETITLTYRQPRAFLRDQRHLGVLHGLLGELPWQQWRRVFAAWQRIGQERGEAFCSAAFEIVYGHAWKAEAKTLDDGRAIIQFHPGRST